MGHATKETVIMSWDLICTCLLSNLCFFSDETHLDPTFHLRIMAFLCAIRVALQTHWNCNRGNRSRTTTPW